MFKFVTYSVIVVALVSIAGFMTYEKYYSKEFSSSGDIVYEALEGDSSASDRAQALEQISSDTLNPYFAEANLILAADAHAAGEFDKAAEFYKKVASNSKTPKVVRDLAEYMECSTFAASGNYAGLDACAEEIANDKDFSFESSSKTLKAIRELKSGNNTEAAKTFLEVANSYDQRDKDGPFPSYIRDLSAMASSTESY